MKSGKLNILLLLLNSILFSSCATDIFHLNRSSLNKTIPGYYLTGFASVDVLSDNSLMLKENASISLKNIESTEWLASFDILSKGKMNINLQFRTSRHQREKYSGIVVKIRNSFIELYENNKKIGERIDYNFSKNEMYSIKILNDGARVKVLVDCDEVIDYRTKLLSTEYLIFKSISEEFIISSLEFEDVYQTKVADFF
jgi:hypothetical protein